MVIFHSYVSLPEGTWHGCTPFELIIKLSSAAFCFAGDILNPSQSFLSVEIPEIYRPHLWRATVPSVDLIFPYILGSVWFWQPSRLLVTSTPLFIDYIILYNIFNLIVAVCCISLCIQTHSPGLCLRRNFHEKVHSGQRRALAQQRAAAAGQNRRLMSTKKWGLMKPAKFGSFRIFIKFHQQHSRIPSDFIRFRQQRIRFPGCS